MKRIVVLSLMSVFAFSSCATLLGFAQQEPPRAPTEGEYCEAIYLRGMDDQLSEREQRRCLWQMARLQQEREAERDAEGERQAQWDRVSECLYKASLRQPCD